MLVNHAINVTHILIYRNTLHVSSAVCVPVRWATEPNTFICSSCIMCMAVNLMLISALLENEGLFARGNSWKVYYITAMRGQLIDGYMCNNTIG